jgi:hypothetical protein
MTNSEELIGITEYPTLQTGCHINRYRCNRVQLYMLRLTQQMWALF